MLHRLSIPPEEQFRALEVQHPMGRTQFLRSVHMNPPSTTEG